MASTTRAVTIIVTGGTALAFLCSEQANTLQIAAAVFVFATPFAYGAAAGCWGQSKCEGKDSPEHRATISRYPDVVDRRRRAHHSAPAVVATASVP
ncbi:MAG: hypothetical protein ACPG4T_23755, partial [Nannocystaceae bacterium]